MKNIRAFLFSLLVLLLSLLCTQAQVQAQERITDFAVTLHIDSSNLLTVQERISIIAEGEVFRRGLIRNIPYLRTDSKGTTYSNPITVLSVTQDGAPATYIDHSKSGKTSIKIGDADIYLAPGEHTYNIIYTIPYQVGFYDTYDEIYWNVTGNQWGIAIDKASCEVVLPSGAKPLQTACYTGYASSQSQNCKHTDRDGNTYFTTADLSAFEGLTIALGFTQGFIAPPPSPSFFKTHILLLIAIVFLLSMIIYMAYSWRKHGKDPKMPTIIPHFQVPRDLSPARLGFYHNQQLLPELFTVGIISLATKGFIKITEISTTSLFIFKDSHYTISQLKPILKADLPIEERAIMNGLFSSGKSSITVNGKYQQKLATTKDNFEIQFHNDKKDIKTASNESFLWTPFILIIAFWIVISFYDFASVFLSLFTMGAILLLPLLLYLLIYVFQFLFRRNYTLSSMYKTLLIVTAAICIGIVLLDVTRFDYNTKVILIFSLMSMLLFFIYQYAIKRPTQASIQLKAEIAGFKMYMLSAEQLPLQNFNPPTLTPALFEQLLPYAIVLGIEKIWGEKFQNIIEKGMTDHSYQPTWYAGNSLSLTNFSTITNHFASNLSKSSDTPTPSSRGGSSSSGGSSWSSGSSGGGYSGGGGGGGGGGGW